MPDESEEQQDRYQRALAAGLGAVVGAAVAGPIGLIGGAALAPLLEPMAAHIWEELGAAGRRRAGQVLSAAVDAGVSPDELLDRINASDRTQLLAGYALAAAARTAWQDKVRTLGRSLAAGLLAEDDANIDTEQIIIAAIADIEGPHLTLLDLLTCYEPVYVQDSRHSRLDIPTYSYKHSADRTWAVGNRYWDVTNIRNAHTQLGSALPSLLGTLQRHGLAAESTDTNGALAQITRFLDRDAGPASQWHIEEDPQIPMQRGSKIQVRVMWSPTELGEQLFLRFRDAGAELPDAWNDSPPDQPRLSE
jgi:hypothetical protein